MNRYWLRITLGALLVFGLGMAGLVVVQRGKAEAQAFLAGAARFPMRLADYGFRLDGQKVGELTSVQVQRRDRLDTGTITAEVRMSDPAALARLQGCFLTMDQHARFSCAEAVPVNFTKAGEIRFQPGDLVRPLYLSRRMAEDWRRSDLQGLNASVTRDARGGVQASGKFEVLDRQSGPHRGSFDLKADSQGAALSVRDDQGRPILDLSAYKSGFRFDLRHRNGLNLVKILGDSLGAALRISK